MGAPATTTPPAEAIVTNMKNALTAHHEVLAKKRRIVETCQREVEKFENDCTEAQAKEEAAKRLLQEAKQEKLAKQARLEEAKALFQDAMDELKPHEDDEAELKRQMPYYSG